MVVLDHIEQANDVLVVLDGAKSRHLAVVGDHRLRRTLVVGLEHDLLAAASVGGTLDRGAERAPARCHEPHTRTLSAAARDWRKAPPRTRQAEPRSRSAVAAWAAGDRQAAP